MYDGVQKALPFQISNGGQLSCKTVINNYATTNGTYQSRDAYFNSNVGIGTVFPDEKLTVRGRIHT